MNSRTLTFFFVVVGLASTLQAQVLFSDDFNSDSSADYTTSVSSADTEVQFAYDYSALGIPAAPNTTDATTLGLRMAANLVDPTGAEGVTLATVTEFTGDFTVRFDAWINANGPFPGGGGGSTEFVTAGVGGDGSTLNQGGASGSGAWAAVSGEGGSSRDYRMYKDGNEQFAESGQFAAGLSSASGGAHNSSDPYYNGFGSVGTNLLPVQGASNGGPAQQTGITAAGTFGFVWHEVELVVDSSGGTGGAPAMTWSIDGLRVGTLDAGTGAAFTTDGRATIGFMDIFSSVSDNAALSFGVVDNLQVEVTQAPTIRIAQSADFGIVYEDGASTDASFVIENRGDADLTVTEVNFTGDDSGSFSLSRALPFTLSTDDSTTVMVTYTAAGDRGVKIGQVEFVSTDAQEPSIVLPLRVAFAAPLLAHYKLDETSGATVIEASGNSANGVFTITDPLVYGAEALATGTSIGFTAAQFPPAGNFAFMPPLHVPTTSISLWIKPEAGDGGEDTLFNRDPEFSGADAIYGCFVDGLGRLTFRSGGEVALQSDDGAIVDDETYHVVITHLDDDGFGNTTATRSRMYINGAMVAENNSPTGFGVYPAGASTQSFYLATRSAAGTGFDGLIDDLQIYSIEITPAQVANMFGAPGVTAFDDIPEFAFTDISYNPATRATSLTWNSLPGAFYILEQSTDGKEWLELTDGITSGGLSTTHTFIADETGGTLLFRAQPEE